jgi:uncharacterized cupredoxin-like copper-binding protein
MMPLNLGRRLLAPIPALLLLATPALAAGPTVVQVQLDNTGNVQQMTLDHATVPAGPVRFEVENASMDQVHEMILVRTDLKPQDFKTNQDGSRVDEDQFKDAQEVEDIEMGEMGELSTTLAPGHYVLFCNIKNHFKDGMRAELTAE